MRYNDIFIRCYLNTSEQFQMNISSEGIVSEGGTIHRDDFTMLMPEYVRKQYRDELEKSQKTNSSEDRAAENTTNEPNKLTIEGIRQIYTYEVDKYRNRKNLQVQIMNDFNWTTYYQQIQQSLDQFSASNSQAVYDACLDFVVQWHSLMETGSTPLDYSELIEFSQRLFAVFPSESFMILKRALERARAQNPACGLRIIIAPQPNARQILDLPWELMLVPFSADLSDPPRQFFALNGDVVIIRQVERRGRFQPIAIDPSLPMHVWLAQLPSNAYPLIDAPHFRAELAALKPNEPQASWWSEDADTLQSLAMRLSTDQPQIVQLICHGTLSSAPNEATNTQRSDLLVTAIQNGVTVIRRISSFELAPLLLLNPRLQLVVLTVCNSSGPQNLDPKAIGVVSNIAYELVEAGIPMVIGMQTEVDQAAAAQFSTALYRSLQRGDPIEQALTNARITISSHSGMDWSVPVVYRGDDTRDIPAWHTRLADRVETLLLHPAHKRGVRAGFISLMLMILVGSLLRWWLLPSSVSINLHDYQRASRAWFVIGAVNLLALYWLMRIDPRQTSNMVQHDAVVGAKLGGMLLGYVLTAYVWLVIAIGLFNIAGDLMPPLAWWLVWIASIASCILMSYTIARSQVRGAIANVRLNKALYSGRTWLILGVGMAILTLFLLVAPQFMLNATLAPLLRMGVGGVLSALLSLLMIRSVEQN